jgi:hypothetical protein
VEFEEWNNFNGQNTISNTSTIQYTRKIIRQIILHHLFVIFINNIYWVFTLKWLPLLTRDLDNNKYQYLGKIMFNNDFISLKKSTKYLT